MIPEPTVETETVTFAGKVKGDGDNTRLIYYSGASTSELSPAALVSEVGSGYAGSASLGDGQSLTYSISTGTGRHVQFQFLYEINPTNLDQIKFRVKGTVGQPFTLRAWNVVTQAWDTATTVTYDGVNDVFVSMTLTDMSKYLDSNNDLRISMLSTNVYSSGTLTLSTDYVELIKTYIR